MIFATVGTQLPFPRMIAMLRDIVDREQQSIYAQTIDCEYEYRSKGVLTCVKVLAPEDYDKHFAAADVVISHAGIGSIISAARFEKPIILVPRRHDLGEHRNDHQGATATNFSESAGVYLANSADEVNRLVGKKLEARPSLTPANSNLIAGIRRFINGEDVRIEKFR